ncbi:MAG: radical SAM protein [Candidatus Vogelbacteria bacterium]|nr:radical SAM protein [Candidatus Vogelbacteria bacterium]
MDTQKTEPKHDFASKLKQDAILEKLKAYVAWQRSVRQAKTRGDAPQPMPTNWGPISVNLDLTTACNYACTHCIDWNMLNSKARYEHALLMTSLENMVENGLRSVILIGGGEPTLYPGFSEVVRFLKGHAVQIGIVSNGSHNDKILEITPLLTQKDWVRFSLDSGTNETFVRMHQPKKKISLEEICASVPMLRNANPSIGIGFSFIVVWPGAERDSEKVKIIPNIHEMMSAAKLALKSGFTYISFKPILTRHPEGAEVMDTEMVENFNATVALIRDTLEETKKLETPNFKVIASSNLMVLINGNRRDFTKQPKMCHMMAFRQVISPLGVFNCPAHRGELKARMGEATAYVKADSQDNFRQATAEILQSFDASHECREVTCLYNGANHMIERMVSEEEVIEIQGLPDQGDYFL